jgi:hypothetical protein
MGWHLDQHWLDLAVTLVLSCPLPLPQGTIPSDNIVTTHLTHWTCSSVSLICLRLPQQQSRMQLYIDLFRPMLSNAVSATPCGTRYTKSPTTAPASTCNTSHGPSDCTMASCQGTCSKNQHAVTPQEPTHIHVGLTCQCRLQSPPQHAAMLLLVVMQGTLLLLLQQWHEQTSCLESQSPAPTACAVAVRSLVQPCLGLRCPGPGPHSTPNGTAGRTRCL